MNFKELLKLFVPPIFLNIKRYLFPLKAPNNSNLIDPARERAFWADNASCLADQIRLRPELPIFNISEESRDSFSYFCYKDSDMVQELDSFLKIASGKKAMLDVGALHGIFSLCFVAVNQDARALAIEPSISAYPDLLYNIDANCPTRISARRVALSDKDGTLEMLLNWKHLRVIGAGTQVEGELLKIPCMTGDQLCQQEGFQPDLIKIDVEGFELAVLAGLKTTIQANKPTLALEIHPKYINDLGGALENLEDYLSGYKYKLLDSQLATFELAALKNLREITRLIAIPN